MKVLPVVLNAFIEEFRNAGHNVSKNDMTEFLRAQNFKAVQDFVDKDLEKVRASTPTGQRETAFRERMALHEGKFRTFGSKMARRVIAGRSAAGSKSGGSVAQPA